MRDLCRHILLVSLVALPLSLNTAYAGQHTPIDSFSDMTPQCSYGHDPIISKIENQAGYAEIVSSLEKSLKPNENILCSFRIDNYGRIKNLKVCSDKAPTALEKKILALIAKTSPFPYPTKQEMIDRGVHVEFWKADRILSVARIAPAPAKPKDTKTPIDNFSDLRKSSSY
jgi:hypothetical protein